MSIWFYISFADPKLPEGTQFLGGCYVKLSEEYRKEDELAGLLYPRRIRELDDEAMLTVRAICQSYRLGINPGGEAMCLGPLTDEQMDEDVPEIDRERLLTREELDRV